MNRTAGAPVALGARRALATLLVPAVALTLALAGCATPKCDTCDQVPTCEAADQSTPVKTLASLVCAYQTADCRSYAALLADDFRFHFDQQTFPGEGPESWATVADSAATCHLFTDPLVTSIRIELAFAVDTPATGAGREEWRQIRVADTWLAVDRNSVGGGEPLTYLIDGDQQDFFFRQGRTPADTLAGSPTAQRWFIVEWRDLAKSGTAARRVGARSAAPAVAPFTWSRLKLIYSD